MGGQEKQQEDPVMKVNNIEAELKFSPQESSPLAYTLSIKSTDNEILDGLKESKMKTLIVDSSGFKEVITVVEEHTNENRVLCWRISLRVYRNPTYEEKLLLLARSISSVSIIPSPSEIKA